MMSPIDINNQAQLSKAFAGRRVQVEETAEDEYQWGYGSGIEGGVQNPYRPKQRLQQPG